MIFDSGIDILPDNNGNFFIASYDTTTNRSIVTYFDTSGDTPVLSHLCNAHTDTTLTLDYKYTSINYNNNTLYISHPDANGTEATMEKYTISSDKKFTPGDYPVTLFTTFPSSQNITVGSNDIIFIIDPSEPNVIYPYTIDDGMLDDTLTYNNENFVSVTTDTSRNNLYALTESNKLLKYDIKSNNYIFSGNLLDNTASDLSSGYKILNDTTFISANGTIYNLNDNDFTLKSTATITDPEFNMDLSCTAIAGFDKSFVLAKVSDTTINCFNCSDGTATGKIDLLEKIIAVSASKDKTIVITENNENKNIHIITQNDVKPIAPPTVDPDPGKSPGKDPDDKDPDDKDPENPTDPDNPNPNPDDDSITSNIHYIDYENHMISEIPIGTTIGEFKNNFDYNGYSLSFKDSKGKSKSSNSAKIGTGYTVTFSKDGVKSCSFTLIVEGDLTGTGKITSRDINLMSNHILGKSSLEGIYLKAADINHDGDADAIDLLLMYKMIQK